MPGGGEIKRTTGQRWTWQPPWRFVLPMALFLPVLLGLGTWQLERAEWKQGLLERLATRDAAGPLDAAGLLALDDPAFARVRVAGRFLPERQVLLDNRTHVGRAGYEVISPFLTDGGVLLAVNRGWLPAPPRRDVLPGLPLDPQWQEITGQAYVLDAVAPIYGAEEADSGWPRRIQRWTPDAVPGLFRPLPDDGADVRAWFPHQVLLAAGHPAALVRNWTPRLLQPDTHRGYAAQWFGLAAVLTALLLRMSLRRAAPT